MSAPVEYPTDRVSLERDCAVEPLRASGPGGQHRNKRETGIRLTHLPSGTVVMATERRSRAANLDAAFARMAARLTAAAYVPEPRRPTRPTRASVRRRLEDKRRQSAKKTDRRDPDA